MWSQFCKNTDPGFLEEEYMELKIRKWRSHWWNRKCAFCKHCAHPPVLFGISAPAWCKAKKKNVHECWPRWFCSLYCEKEAE